jgi:hypothetical protein
MEEIPENSVIDPAIFPDKEFKEEPLKLFKFQAEKKGEPSHKVLKRRRLTKSLERHKRSAERPKNIFKFQNEGIGGLIRSNKQLIVAVYLLVVVNVFSLSIQYLHML